MTQKLQTNWKSFATTAGLVAGGAFAVYRGLKQVYDLGKEGAALDYQAGKFDRLADSVGATSDALIRDLRAATKGTRSDMELMAGAGDLMALGLAKSYDEVVRLTRVVGGLGMDMNQLVLTLTNQTTMRFDQLGVSVDGFDAKVQKLKESGMSANDAFKEAFLQQAEDQLKKVGDKADTDAGKIARMEAATKNLGDAFKLWLAPGVAAAAEGIADALTASQRLEDRAASLINEYSKGAITLQEYRTETQKLAEEFGYNISAAGELTETVSGYGYTAEVAATDTRLLAEAHIEIIEKWRTSTTVLEDMNERLKTEKDLMGEVKNETLLASDAMKSYSDNLLFAIASEGLSDEAALRLAYSMGLVDDATVFATGKQKDWKRQLDEGKITQAEYNALIAGMARAIDGLQSKEIDITVNHYDNYYTNAGAGTGGGGASNGDTVMHATGGEFIIPSGYTETYPVGPRQTASSGEKVTITPVGQTDTTDGIQIVMNNPVFTDPVEMESQVYRMVQDIIRRL